MPDPAGKAWRISPGLGFLVLCFLGLAQEARAQAWPDRPVRIVVPFAAGGTTDVLARVLAERLAIRLGQPVIIENIGGAGGNAGAATVANARPDGTVFLMSTPGPAVMNQFLYSKMPYDTGNAFTPVVLVATIPSVLILNPAVEAKTLANFGELLRAKPGALNFGSAGNGSTGHLGGAMLTKAFGASAQHVPYRGSAPMLADLVGGQIQFTIDSLPGAIGLIRAGTVRALAVTSTSRLADLPGVPTFAEQGMPQLGLSTWVALLAPAGTPPAIIERMNAEANMALADPALRAKFTELGASVEGRAPADLSAFLKTETGKWKQAIDLAGARIE